MTNDDLQLIKQMLASPAWKLYTEAIKEEIASLEAQADQPKIDTDYRLWLLAKSKGMQDVFNKVNDLLK